MASVSTPVTSINSICLKCSHVEQYASQEPEPETFKFYFLDFSLFYNVCRLCHSRFMSSLFSFPLSFSTSFSNKESLNFRSRYSVRWRFRRAGFELKKTINVSLSTMSNFTFFSAFSSSSVKKNNLSKNFHFFFGALSFYFSDCLLKPVRRAWKFLSRKSSENLQSKRLTKSSFTADFSSMF